MKNKERHAWNPLGDLHTVMVNQVGIQRPDKVSNVWGHSSRERERAIYSGQLLYSIGAILTQTVSIDRRHCGTSMGILSVRKEVFDGRLGGLQRPHPLGNILPIK